MAQLQSSIILNPTFWFLVGLGLAVAASFTIWQARIRRYRQTPSGLERVRDLRFETRRAVAGIALIILALSLMASSGPLLFQPALGSNVGGTVNACTTIVTSGPAGNKAGECTLPATVCASNGNLVCWTQVQNGVKTCTINAGQTNCSALVTFSPSYTLVPQGSVNFVTGTVAATVSTNGLVPVPTTLFFQAVNNTNWKLIPAADTELYGKTNQRLEWTTPSSWSAQMAQFCVNVSNVTSVDSPVLKLQSATSLAGPWTTMGDASFTISPTTTGFQCGLSETISLSTSTLYYFRVVGNDASGFNPGVEPDDLGLGLVQLYMTGTFTTTLSVPVGCTTTISVAPTTTSMTVGATCGSQGISAPKTFTIDWWAGIPA